MRGVLATHELASFLPAHLEVPARATTELIISGFFLSFYPVIDFHKMKLPNVIQNFSSLFPIKL